MIRPGNFLKILVISIFLSVMVGISSYPQTVIDPTLTLDAAGIVDQDDMCVWINQNDKSLSTIITSDKSANKLFVYDLSGNALQTIDVPGKPGNIDIRYNFVLSSVPTDIVSYNDRTNGSIVFYKVDHATRQLSFVSSFSDGGMTGDNYGICLYHSLITNKYYAIASSNSTQMKQWELVDSGNGTIGGLLKRTWNNGTGDITEGLVADDEIGILYAANEGEGIYKYNAEPNDPNPVGELIAPTGVNGLTADVEGITLYYTSMGNGYLIASSQGSSSFKVYERQAPNNFVKTVQINGVGQTDGIDVSNLSLGPSFPLGLFLTHDGTGSPYVIRGCKWEDFGLEIDTTYWDPTIILRAPTNLAATVVSQTQINVSWTDNSNYEDGFKIERKQGQGGQYAEIATVGTNVTSYLDSNFNQGVSYLYRVGAYNNSGQSVYSNASYVTSILPAPTNLVGQFFSGSPSTVLLNWQDVSNNEMGFVIERDTEGFGKFEKLDSIGSNLTSYEDTNFVNPVGSFYYRLYAVSEDTVSDYSNVAETIIPVELISFSASVIENSVTISWVTATETNNMGFELERKLYTDWKKLAFIEGRGSTTEESNYQFIDEFKNEEFKGVIFYRLKKIDFSGAYEYSDITEVSVNFKPTEFVFYQNYPNPFNPVTTIKYSLPKESNVTIKIFDILGNEVRTLVKSKQQAGTYEVEFKGTDLVSGIYIYQIQTESFSSIKKMLLMK